MTLDPRHCRQIHEDPHGEHWDAALRDHAAACPSCRAYLDGVAALGERLRRLPSMSAPMPQELKEGLLAKLEASSQTSPSGPTSSGFRSKLPILRGIAIPVALAASLVLGVLLGHDTGFKRPTTGGEVASTVGKYISDVTHDHYLFERINRPLEVAMNDPRELSQWLSESLNFSLALPRTGPDFTLQGGRVWHTLGRLSALASYTTGDGARTILFAVPAENIVLSGADSKMIHGRQVFSGTGWHREARVWIDGDLAMALVALDGRLPADWPDTFLPFR